MFGLDVEGVLGASSEGVNFALIMLAVTMRSRWHRATVATEP